MPRMQIKDSFQVVSGVAERERGAHVLGLQRDSGAEMSGRLAAELPSRV